MGGFNAITDRIRVSSVGHARNGVQTKERTLLVFAISYDLVAELFRMHDELYKVYLYNPKPLRERWREHRVEFGRLMDMRIPGVLLRIEPPSYNPHGGRLWLPKGSRSFHTQVAARKLRVKPNLDTKVLEHMVAEDMRGIMVTFPDEDMQDIDALPPLAPREKPIPVNDRDMAVHRDNR